jgi:hypothetical protein
VCFNICGFIQQREGRLFWTAWQQTFPIFSLVLSERVFPCWQPMHWRCMCVCVCARIPVRSTELCPAHQLSPCQFNFPPPVAVKYFVFRYAIHELRGPQNSHSVSKEKFGNFCNFVPGIQKLWVRIRLSVSMVLGSLWQFLLTNDNRGKLFLYFIIVWLHRRAQVHSTRSCNVTTNLRFKIFLSST